MANEIQLAAKGDRRAMLSVYENNKRPVFFLSRYFLGDEAAAAAKTKAIFAQLWEDLSAGTAVEGSLRKYLCEKTVRSCIEEGTLDDGKELFAVKARPEAGSDTGTYISWLLDALTLRYKTFFLLQSVCERTARQTAPLLGMEGRAAEIQWHAAENALTRQLAKLQIKDSIGTLSYSVLCQEVHSMAEEMKIPLETDTAVQENIMQVTKAKYQRRNKLIAVVTAAVIVVAGIVGGILYADRQKDLVKAEIEIENHGTISLTLDKREAPITVENFVKLANEGFYDGLTFHRIIAGFMMQGGCPNGNGSGGSDEKIVGEFFYNGYSNNLSHERGVISMARSNDNNSASSQFFIMHQDYTGLDGQYAAFGWVTDGIEIVDAICESAQPVDNNGTILPEQQPKIVTVRILE